MLSCYTSTMKNLSMLIDGPILVILIGSDFPSHFTNGCKYVILILRYDFSVFCFSIIWDHKKQGQRQINLDRIREEKNTYRSTFMLDLMRTTSLQFLTYFLVDSVLNI